MKRSNLLTVALLGVVVGVLLSLLVVKFVEGSHKRNWQAGNWRKMYLVLDYVKDHYVDTIDAKAVTEAALSAALQKLDPHSTYMPPVLLEETETELSGNFEGIGIQFNVPGDTAIVLSPIAGGPSQKAGILQGDRIVKVDERVIAGVRMPQDSMVRLMKGPAGTKVRITVRRDREEIAFDITRDKIPVNCIDAAFMVSDTTGYIRLSKFTRTTYQEFRQASSKLLGKGMKKLIFDLRDNSGGYFDQACLLCNEFLPKGALVVYMEGLHYPKEEVNADGRGSLQDIDLSVLINESSASSSEIFAGAIQDNDRGVIVGRRSFGKGLVQEPLNFNDGSGIRLTVARFHTPSGRCIQKPYSEDYAYDIYDRYARGEMTEADSIKVNTDDAHYTVGGRTVYGGGGIIPDVFVPIDTTKASKFYLACNRKTTQMRFASDFFDHNKKNLSAIDDYGELLRYLESSDVESKFLQYAASHDKIVPAQGEWEETRTYMMPQVNALVGRYSKLGEDAFYHLYLDIDDVFLRALQL